MQCYKCYAAGANSFEIMLYIGSLIKKKMKEQRLSVAAFAKLINTDRNNVYNIFSRQSMDTELLFTSSIILKHDFFQYYRPIGIQTADTPKLQEISFDWLQQQLAEIKSKIDALRS